MNQHTRINEENVKSAFRFMLQREPNDAALSRFHEAIGSILTDVEERVIVQRFNFYGDFAGETPFSEIAAAFGVSEEKIESVYRKAVTKIRSPFATKAIMGKE